VEDRRVQERPGHSRLPIQLDLSRKEIDMITNCKACGKTLNSFDLDWHKRSCPGRVVNVPAQSLGGGFGSPNQNIQIPVRNREIVGKNVKVPCQSCGKYVGPREGQMMRSGDVFCMLCLNTGKYLKVGKTGKYVKKGTQRVYDGRVKPAGEFGR